MATINYWAVVPFTRADGSGGTVYLSSGAVRPFRPAAERPGRALAWAVPSPTLTGGFALERVLLLATGFGIDLGANAALLTGVRPPLFVYGERWHTISWVVSAGPVQEIVMAAYGASGGVAEGGARVRWDGGVKSTEENWGSIQLGAVGRAQVGSDWRVWCCVAFAPGLVVLDARLTAGGPASQQQTDRGRGPAPLMTGTGSAAGEYEGVIWEPRLMEPANVEIGLFSDPTRGIGEVGGGTLVIGNADGEYSFLADCAIGEIKVHVGRGDETAWSQTVPVMRAAAGRADPSIDLFQPSRVTIPLFDGRVLLDGQLAGRPYAGTSNGTSGYEGTSEAAGTPRPVALGDLTGANVPAVTCNPRSNAVQWHDGPIQAITALWVRGGPAGLTNIGDLSGSAFDSAGLSAGQRTADLSRGLLRYGGSLSGALSADLKGAVVDGAYVDTGPKLVRAALRLMGVPAGQIGPSFDTIGTAGLLGAKCGVWVRAGETAADVVDTLLRSFMGWCARDAFGVWQIGQFGPPASVPVATFGPTDLLSLERAPWGFDAPPKEVVVQWGRNYAPMDDNDIPGSLTSGAGADPARVDYLRREWRATKWESATNAARWGASAASVTIDTALRTEADAVTLKNRWGAVFGVPRRSIRIVVPMSANVWGLQLGQTVAIAPPAHGMDGLYVVRAIRPTAPKFSQMTLSLWG